jgi:class 3 adenylate cyclase/tetratricopeptide (TPR) repeat protein
MDVEDWLRKLGFEQYEPAFREHEIDERTLPNLTAEDLKDLGVRLVGHRRRLLDAIAALSIGTVDTTARAPIDEASVPTDAERRQLTILFCDLVGSTALSTRLDPEDLREVIGAYHRAVAAEVSRFGGFVAKYMGDGALAYFGYPQAHEDDAERAVRTGLALTEHTARLETRARLQARVGIATGLVVVGDLVGAGEAQERGVVGETPNLAARLQALAEPGAVVVADGTRRLLGDLFQCRDLGAVSIKGFATPVSVWQVLRPHVVESRFEALHAGTVTPLVGREEELELLQRRWRRATAGEGQVVLLSGEPGIGKSRLTAALRQLLRDEPHVRLSYFCSTHYQDSALHPFIAQLERAAGFARDDPPDTRLDKLEALLAPAAPPPAELTLLAELLSLSTARYQALQLSPQLKKQRTFAALMHQLSALARRQPLLIVFEDLHWSDPSSRELLDLMIERVADLPVLLILTFRPEFQTPWSGLPQTLALSINRLDLRTGTAMVERIAAGRELPEALAAEIAARADGVPLFIEELAHAVIEAGAEGEALAGRVPPPSAGVPAALSASLMARLDRLGPIVRRIAQIGAVIGRDFSYELLALVSGWTAPELADALGRLTDSGLVHQRGVPPAATYMFKHALVRDAAYASLLRRRRQELHGAVAAALERQFPDIVAAAPELLAYHASEAGLTDRAVEHWQRAGERARERSANLEAIAHLTRGLDLLKLLPETRERDEQELCFQVALIAPYMRSRGFAAPEHGRVALRAAELCERLGGHAAEHISALWSVAAFRLARGAARTALAAGEECLALAEWLQDPGPLGVAHFVIGDLLFWLGQPSRAHVHLEQGIALYDPARGRSDALRGALSDNGVSCHAFLARTLWHLGYPDQAMAHSGRAMTLAEDTALPASTALALGWAAALHQLRGEVDDCGRLAAAGLAFATEQALPHFAANAMVLEGWARVKQRREEEGRTRLREGIAAYRATGGEIELPHWLGLLAQACCDTGQAQAGLTIVAEMAEHAAQTGIIYYEPEQYRIEGELRLATDPVGNTGQQKHVSGGRWSSPGRSRQSPGNCASPSASPDSFATTAAARKRASFLRRSITGLPKASAPPICRRRRHSSTDSRRSRTSDPSQPNQFLGRWG